MISLIGHYEKIAFEITKKKYSQYLNFDQQHHLRFNTKKIGSLIYFFSSLVYFSIYCFLNNKKLLFAIPRSNSRAITLPITLVFKNFFYTYSDGLGDAIHRFKLESLIYYLGHIGSKKLHPKNIVLDIPIKRYFETWENKIVYDQNGPILIVVKYPKEINFDSEKLDHFYSNFIQRYKKNNQIILSGYFRESISNNKFKDIQIGPIYNIGNEIKVSKVIGFPSTLFLTFAKKLPKDNIIILTLPKCSADIISINKINRMRKILLSLIVGIKNNYE